MNVSVWALVSAAVLVLFSACSGDKTGVEKPNAQYSPSFIEPVLHKGSLSDWKKATFGGAKSDTVRYKGRLFLGTVVDKHVATAQHFSLQHLFIIPTGSRELGIRLTGRFDYPNGISPVYLVVRKYVKGSVVEKDSINLLRTSTLHAWSPVFTLPERCSDLDISIESRGQASYLLDSMVVHIDGIDVADLELAPSAEWKPSRLNDLKRNLSDTFSVEQLGMKQPRILGLGESVHGSMELCAEQYRLIRQLIDENRLDVLLIECSQPVGDRLNRYVTGVSDTMGGTNDLGLYAHQGFVELLDYIRRFNSKQSTDPVLLGGYDVTFDRWPNGLPTSSLRDSLMFVRVRDVAERLGPAKKVVVQGHLGHLIKTADYGKPEFTAPLGYYLDRTFGNNFNVVGFFVGTGERLCKVDKPGIGMVMDTVALANPLHNSLEQLLLQTGKRAFYVSGWQEKPWMDGVFRCRRGGMTLADAEFFPFIVDDIDVVYFTRNSKAL